MLYSWSKAPQKDIEREMIKFCYCYCENEVMMNEFQIFFKNFIGVQFKQHKNMSEFGTSKMLLKTAIEINYHICYQYEN